jgi:glycosyltransferase involved in cell wall biosynthesis
MGTRHTRRDFRILTSDAGREHSGPGRFLLNLCRGLKAARHSVSVCSLHGSSKALKAFGEIGVPLDFLSAASESTLSLVSKITPSRSGARKLSNLATKRAEDPIYIVLSDDLVDASRFLPNERSVLISNGDYALLFFQRPFFSNLAIGKRVLSAGAASMILTHGDSARQYALRAANSQFTKTLMSFLYNVTFDGIVYPPVDLDVFKPPSTRPLSDYALAVVRNNHESGIGILEILAKKIPLTVVGGGKVNGARNLGFVSDSDLVRVYSNASFLVSPTLVEPFGYPVAEALACGTPCIVFDAAGPGELIRDDVNGWKAGSHEVFEDLVVRKFGEGTHDNVRRAARESAMRFSIQRTCECLDVLLDQRILLR